jgi:hypothetical protein
MEALSRPEFYSMLLKRQFDEITSTALKIESKTNLLFSFEKMALRDAVKGPEGARTFAEGLYEFVYGRGKPDQKFARWSQALEELPRKLTRVLTWPVATVFGFIARPDLHIFYKPRATQAAAKAYGFDLHYASRPTWEGYQNLLEFAELVHEGVKDMKPRDMIDIQSFLWVTGSKDHVQERLAA